MTSRGVPIVWSSTYEVDLGPHVFVTAKYRLTRAALLARGTVTEAHILPPVPATREELGGVHTDEYLRKIDDDTFSPFERAQLEVPFTPELREAMVLCCGGTLLAARLAMDDGVAVHLGGGFHHAFAGHGEGFCLLNDVAVAAGVLLKESAVRRVAVVDLDVHHGNGTASIFAGEPAVFTFSMHQENNYPALKPPSDLDLGLEDGTGDDEYLDLLVRHLPRMLDDHRPDVVFYLAGADPYLRDQLGGLSLTRDGLRQRDKTVFSLVRERGRPVVAVLAGGYAHRLEDTVSIHVSTVEEAVAASTVP